MRLYAIAAGTGLAVVLTARPSHALTFPRDAQWIPLTCNGQVVTDVAGEVQPPAVDVVGDAADPAGYFYMDSANLFLRLRMNATGSPDAGTYDPDAWACLLRTANTPDSYLAWDGVDGLAMPSDVELLQNTQPKPGIATQQPATMVVATYPVATNAREIAATTNLGGNPNFFVDWAVSLSDLAKVGITPSTPVTFICGTSKTQHVLDGDIVGDEQACPGGFYDAMQCPGGNCTTCTTPAACGPNCTACGGATPRCDPAIGCVAACTSNAQCSGATPVCDTARGLCVECTSNANCPSGTTCNAASGLCVGCTSNASCPAGTYCDTASGTCTPCAQGAPSCTGPGSAGSTGSSNVLANGKIEGGAGACDIGGSGASPGVPAVLALGIASALRSRRRRRSHHRPSLDGTESRRRPPS
jgi:Cys-rich repeat protein